jgi:Ca2+-binding RTX toxin-like protein
MLWHPILTDASSQVTGGSSFAGVSGPSLNGVVKVTTTIGGKSYIGSGALIGKQYVLTAAHVVDGATAANTKVGFDIFDTATSAVRNVTMDAEALVIHPNYDMEDSILEKIRLWVLGAVGVEVPFTQNDIAIIKIADAAPLNVGAYEFFTGTTLNQVFLKVGYGLAGDGNTGDVLPAGTKRAGLNTFDRAADGLLFYDFDNGLAANDALGIKFGINNLGLGTAEGITAPGDSGGPAFINGQIASVTSYGSPGGSADVEPTQKSFGDLTADTPVAPFVSSFIQPTISSLVKTNVYEEMTETASAVAAKLLSAAVSANPGFTIDVGSVAFAGVNAAVSTFEAIKIGSIELGSGALLTSGDGTPPLSNTSGSYGKSTGAKGDASLDAAAKAAFSGAGSTQDASVLTFNLVTAEAGSVRFKVVFGSDEFPEFSNTSFVDIAGIFINGVNYAFFGGSTDRPLSVIQANLNGNFINNQGKTLPIEYDGISNVLTITAPVQAGANSVKIAVADTGDGVYDSALWISDLALTTASSTGIKLLVTPPTDPAGANALKTGGGNLDEEFLGFAGKDTIDAGGGNDILDGGEGDDVLNGGAGDDELLGGLGFDIAQYLSSSSAQLILTVLKNSAGSILGFKVQDPSGPEVFADTVKYTDTKVQGLSGLEVSANTVKFTDTLIGVEAIQSVSETITVGSNFEGLFKVSNTNSGENYMVLGEKYAGPVAYLQRQLLGSAGNEVFGGTLQNDFFNALGGDDAINAGAGDDVIDGGGGSNFMTGGTGFDTFFSDGRGGLLTWSTITDWEAGEHMSLFGYRPGISKIQWRDLDGTEGYKGATMHGDLNGDGTIDTSVTWAGIAYSALPIALEFDGLLWFK